MRRKISLKHFFALICATMLFSSCDPAHTNDLYFDNQSGYDILVKYAGIYNTHRNDGYKNVPNGEKTLMLYDSGIGCSGEMNDKYDMFVWLYGDSISFIIDSTKKITYYNHDTLSEDSPYKFHSTHYQHTYIEPNPGNGCDALRSSHTYTITAEQINERLEAE